VGEERGGKEYGHLNLLNYICGFHTQLWQKLCNIHGGKMSSRDERNPKNFALGCLLPIPHPYRISGYETIPLWVHPIS